VPPQLWYRGREITHAREMARHLRQIAEGKLKP
jgi:hypothetical protein